MLLLKYSLPTEDDAEFVIEATANGFLIQHRPTGKSFEFDKTKLEFFPDIAYLTFDMHGEFALFWHFELWHSRDALSTVSVRKFITFNALRNPPVIIFIDAEGAAHLSSDEKCFVSTPGAEIVAVPLENVSFDAVKAHIPGILPFLAYCRAKSRALSRFNPVDAAAGIEYQLDFVYSAVKWLMERLPDDQRPSFWASFTQAVDPSLSLDLIGEEKALTEIASEKSKTRQIQTNYYSELSGG
jgi:hypothetical protein